MKDEKKISWLEAAGVLVILLIAAGLRMGWPGLTQFRADEARLLALAWDMADGQIFPLRGITSSVGLPNFPMSVWLYAVPLLVWSHPYAPTLFTGLVNVLAMALTYGFLRRVWGIPAAMACLLMWAVSPWSVFHARKIWAQNIIAPWVVGWFICSFYWLTQQKARWLVGQLVCAAVAVQIHLGALSLLPATAVLWLIFYRRLLWQGVAAGVAGVLLTLAPFLWYVGQNVDQLRGMGGSGRVFTFSLEPVWHAIRLSTGWQIHALAGPAVYQQFLSLLPPGMGLVYGAWGGVIALGLGWLVWEVKDGLKEKEGLTAESAKNAEEKREEERKKGEGTDLSELLYLFTQHLELRTQHLELTAESAKDAEEKKKEGKEEEGKDKDERIFEPSFYSALSTQHSALFSLIALIWGASAIGTYLFFPIAVEIHYLLAFYPLPYMAAGVFLAQVGQRWGWRVWLPLGVSCVAQAWSVLLLLGFISSTNTAGMSHLLLYQLQAVSYIDQQFEATQAQEVLIVGTGEDPEFDEFASIFAVLLRHRPHRFVNGAHAAVFPAHPAIVLLHPQPTPLQNLYQQLASQRQVVEQRPGEGVLTVLALPGRAAPLPTQSFEPPLLLQNWVNFLGHDQLDYQGNYWFYWRVGDASWQDFHLFTHVLDGRGQRIAQVDVPAFGAWQWLKEDVVVSRFAVPESLVGQRPLTIRTGMYSYPDLAPVYLLDAAANPYSDAAEVQITR